LDFLNFSAFMLGSEFHFFYRSYTSEFRILYSVIIHLQNSVVLVAEMKIFALFNVKAFKDFIDENLSAGFFKIRLWEFLFYLQILNVIRNLEISST
jgi:hypothetical protein